MRWRYALAVHAATFLLGVPGALADYRWDAGADYLGDARQLGAWSDTLDRHATQRHAIGDCLSDATQCRGRLKGLRHLIVKARGLPLERQLQLVNFYVNRHRYRYDRPETRVSAIQGGRTRFRSHWSTLMDFLDHGGDCEDYATAKYFLMRELGTRAEDLRVLVTYERRTRSHHAVLAIRHPDNRIWLLDSDNTIARNTDHGFRFVYALNENGIWDHRTARAQAKTDAGSSLDQPDPSVDGSSLIDRRRS